MKYRIKVFKRNDVYCEFANTYEGMKLKLNFVMVDDLDEKQKIEITKFINENVFIMLTIDDYEFDRRNEMIKCLKD